MSPKTQKNTKTIIVGEGRGFDRIRRITGYLVGTTAVSYTHLTLPTKLEV